MAGSAVISLASAAFAQQSPILPQNIPSQKIATVVKIAGIQWFNRMEEGIRKFAKDTGNDAFQVGPPSADAQLQNQLIEDVIAQGANAITVVPFAPEATELVLARAMAQGIKVVTHEAAGIKNANYDVEAFSNEAYGEQIMKNLAACMNDEGQYAVFVGSLTSKTHNQWVDAAIAYQKTNYPKMELVGSKNESFDDQQKAYAKAQEILRTYPDIKGFQGSASTDVAGIGLAIEERGMENATCVMGTSLPSISGQYLETGAVDKIFFWDPADAGYIMDTVALMLLEGKQVTNGMDLGVDGYNSINLVGNVIYGQAWVVVDNNNKGDYPF